MHFRVILRILGILMMLFSFSMLPPVAVSLIYVDGASLPFLIAFGITLVTGFITWLPFYKVRHDLRTRDGFLITVLFWTVLGLFGSILWYRQQLQWFGGMGIIVLAVAILPMLGIGGMQLYRAETPGPVKDSKLTPRITETAKALWYIYLSLTIACALGYWLAGMTPFDAICHSFSTVAIGGFSTHDDSMGYFNSPVIEAIAIFFMMISAVNFALHFSAWKNRSLLHYWSDPEFRFYLNILLGVTVFCTLVLLLTETFSGISALRRDSDQTGKQINSRPGRRGRVGVFLGLPDRVRNHAGRLAGHWFGSGHRLDGGGCNPQ